MTETMVTKISTKGQIVIPKELRQDLKIEESDEFLIYGEKDTIILKKVVRPSLKERFKELSGKLVSEMKEKGVSKKDVEKAIQTVRRR